MPKLLSRPIAAVAAVAAAVFLVIAIASRPVASSDDSPAAAPAATVPDPVQDQRATASPAARAATPLPAAAGPQLAAAVPDPELREVKATVIAAERGIDITLALAMRLPAAVLPPRSAIWLRAQCLVSGEWYDGTARIALDDIGLGDHVVAHVVVGRNYRLGVAPAACHLAFQRDLVAARGIDPTFAIRCWNGKAVVDGRCAPIPRVVDGKPLVALRGLALRTDVDRAAAGSPRWVDVELEAELARATDWRGRLTADCSLPDGTVQSDTATVWLRFRPGPPFFTTAMMFSSHRLPARPSRCTMRLDLVDDHGLASEPIAVRCWANGAVSHGPCRS